MMRNGALLVALMVLCAVAGRAQEVVTPATTASPAVTGTSTVTAMPIAEKSVTATDTLPAVAITPVASPSVSPSPVLTTTAKETKPATGKSAVTLPPEKAQPVRVTRFETPPVIDGKLDEAVWKGAVVLKDFYQINPGDNIAPSRPTEVL